MIKKVFFRIKVKDLKNETAEDKKQNRQAVS